MNRWIDRFTYHTQEEINGKEYRMDHSKLDELTDYIGEVVIGDYVVYAKNGDFSQLGEYKKDIWEVTDLVVTRDEDFVVIKNISKTGTDFKTYKSNVLDVAVLRSATNEWREYFSKRSLLVYDRLFGNETKQEPEVRKWSGGITIEPTKSGEDDMNMINKVVQSNVGAAKAGAVISAGNTLNKVVKNSVRSQVPRKYRKILDSPAGDFVIANVASFAVQNFAKTNYKARTATDAMMQAAMIEVMNSFNLDQMINDVLANANFDEILDTTGQ